MSVGKWDKIFFRRKKVHSEGEECTGSKRLEDFERQIGLLLHSDRFIARSDYRPIHERYAELHVSLSNLEKMGMLDVYCEKNRIDPKKMERFLCLYEDLGSRRVPRSLKRTMTNLSRGIWPKTNFILIRYFVGWTLM